eukprot:COSAG01_NODE_14805_length_1407_cov_49.665902_2_plen_192_part_00
MQQAAAWQRRCVRWGYLSRRSGVEAGRRQGGWGVRTVRMWGSCSLHGMSLAEEGRARVQPARPLRARGQISHVRERGRKGGRGPWDLSHTHTHDGWAVACSQLDKNRMLRRGVAGGSGHGLCRACARRVHRNAGVRRGRAERTLQHGGPVGHVIRHREHLPTPPTPSQQAGHYPTTRSTRRAPPPPSPNSS